MKRDVLTINGKKDGDIELPNVFETEVNRTLIHKAYINLESHGFQKHSTKPTAGMEVVADSNDPPTGRGVARIAKIKGGGGGRAGQAGEVASTRGGRQAHPPKANKVIYKKLNKKENKLALCSAIAATASKELIEKRGHKAEGIDVFPLVISDDIEKVSKTSELASESLERKPFAASTIIVSPSSKLKVLTISIACSGFSVSYISTLIFEFLNSSFTKLAIFEPCFFPE